MMNEPIHGSVDDANTTLLGVEEKHFTRNFKKYIQKEQLNLSRFDGTDYVGRPSLGWVFWSQLANSAQPQYSFTDNFADLIRNALQKLMGEFKMELHQCLVQFWAARKTSEGRTLLTTQFQPFALGTTSYGWDEKNKLCSYRMGICREYNNSFYADAECAEELLGLPGRVFLNQLPESNPEVKHYTLKEYPQLDLALRCGIVSSWAVPVFPNSSHTCVGVLEIVSLHFNIPVLHHKSFLGHDIFQEFGLLCLDEHKHYEMYEMQIGDKNKASAFRELKTGLETVCKIHDLPLAMTWVPCKACNYLLRGQFLSEGVEFCGHGNFFLPSFVEVSKRSHLRKGGVAGMVLSSPNMLYCSDITQLSLVEYPLVPYARLCNLRGWFTICLQSSFTANDIYVLEFFLPTSNRSYRDNSRTLLSLILGTMGENFKNFKLASGQELGDLLSVEVEDFRNGEILQLGHLDQPPMDAMSNGMNVVTEAQNYNLPSVEPLQSGKVTSQLDSSDQLSMDHSKNVHNVVTAERNIILVTSSDSEVGPRETQERQHKNTGVRIEVSLDDILKCSKMSRKDAAKELQVSVSTLKRKCREYGIKRWRPSPVENEIWLDAHFSYTPTIEEEETINKCMQDGSFRDEFVDRSWISNTTVIEYSEMLGHYLSHCHFFCPNVIKNFNQNGRLLNKILLPKTEKIFFPILRDRHWMLLVIDVKKKCFLWLDSMRCETEKKYSEEFAHFLNHEFVFNILREQNKWPIKYPEDTPIQENGNDCGVYMMAIMISLAVGSKLHKLSQAQAQRMRRTICLELKKRDIIPRCPLVDYQSMFIQERKKNERKESTAALRDEVFIESKRRKYVKWADQVPSESSQIPPHQSSSSDLQPQPSQNKNKAQVQTARKQNWSKEEDEALCKAWLRVSEDAAIGTDQAKGRGVMLQPGHLDQPPMDAISNETNVVSEAQKYNLPSLEPLQSGKVTTQLDSSDQLSMDHSKNAHNVITTKRNVITVTSSDSERIEVSLDDILKYSKKSRNDAAKKLQGSTSTLKRVCRGYGIDRRPPRNRDIKKFRSFRPSPAENEGQARQRQNSDLPSNQASDSVAHTKPAFQHAAMVTIKAKYENNTIKFPLSLPSRLVALQQEVAKRLDLEAGTYYVKYKDEENDSILIACDQDLQCCTHTSKSLGNTSAVVLLELK